MRSQTVFSRLVLLGLLALANASAYALTISAVQQTTAQLNATPATVLPGAVIIGGAGNLNATQGIDGIARSPWSLQTAVSGADKAFQFLIGANSPNNSITYTFGASNLKNKLAFLFGSPDSYNTVQLKRNGGVVQTIVPGLSQTGGVVPVDQTNTYKVTIADVLFDEIVFTTSSNSIEFANVEVTAVPLPAAAWLFISALGGLVVIGRRRQMRGTTA